MASRRPMTLTEAAGSLGVTAATLRQQIANGRLRARRIGPLWTVTPREVERYRRESVSQPGRRAKQPHR
jgi:excisionase family DNA binding protein